MLLEHRENHSGALEVQAAASLRVAQVRRVASCLATWQQQRGRPLIWARLQTPVRRDPSFVIPRLSTKYQFLRMPIRWGSIKM